VSVAAHATGLVLCLCGILGKGTLHPPSRIPTHPFRVLGLVARGMAELQRGANSHDVCFDNLQDFQYQRFLAFYRIICDADCSGVITMYRRFWLWVAKIGQCLSKNHTHLAVVEECSKLCFCHQCNNKLYYTQISVECAVQFYLLPIFGHQAHEKNVRKCNFALLFWKGMTHLSVYSLSCPMRGISP
jgi:hypothetical protein